MLEIALHNQNNEVVRMLSLNESIFGKKLRLDLLNLAVRYQLSKRRQGSASVKNRASVAGGGRKPYRQKGTGSARQGTIRAPQFRTGGVVFGPHPRDHGIDLSKRVRRLALQTALSAKYADGNIMVLDGLEFSEIKTKQLRGRLFSLGVLESVLIVVPQEDRMVSLSARNLPGVLVVRVEGVNVYDLLRFDKLLVTESSLRKLEERLV